MTSPIRYLSAVKLASLIRSKKISPFEVMKETLNTINAVNPKVNAFVFIDADGALREARRVTEEIAAGKRKGPLAGIPLGVKDLEDVKGMVTSFGSVPFKDNVAVTDSVQVARLREAGAIMVGKTNTPEFGSTGFTKNRLFGITRNPWNLEKTPGGSSGGSAAAVVAGMISLATGSDGGGSVRIPASYSGCYGLKTSAGRIPMGPLPMLHMNPIAVLGPLTRTVEDAALFLDCVAGYHPAAPESLPRPEYSYLKILNNLPRSLNIAFSPTLGYATVQNDVIACIEKSVKAFEEMGHRIVRLEEKFPNVVNAWSKLFSLNIYGMLSDNLDTHGPEMGKALVYSLEDIKKLTMADLVEAQKTRTEQNNMLWNLFDQFDLLLTPTMPSEAFAAEGPPPTHINGTPIHILDVVAFTYPFNLSGHPAASVPAGFTKSGMPIGLQIVGPRLRDDLVLQASQAYERVRPWNDRWPEV
ncbi:MAG: amidase family protein [Syntrophales bacterium]|jgi:aspartyl-tRNA(Asn)/glutamyl-tRNA(Gln) amidotransferase subunit A|nr:amidase family protein [Syntrophales bacterium]MDY0043309.1 amidase family protein [Syntrophales bacterium]